MGRAGQQVVRDEDGLEDRISVGLLARAFPRATVEAVIEASGAREQRVRMLPSWLVVYYVLALALFMDMGGGRVMRKLAGTLAWAARGVTAVIPSEEALSRARARLGPVPLRLLFEQVAGPLATTATPGGFWRGRRVLGVDGTTLDVQDTPANWTRFGGPGTASESGRALAGGFPKMRVVALAGSAFPLPVQTVLPDGTCLSVLAVPKSNKDKRRANAGPITVRVVEYHLLEADGSPTETFALLTTLLDPDTAPAAELAELYHARWQIENAFSAFKSQLKGDGVVLRSKTPDGAEQELWALLPRSWTCSTPANTSTSSLSYYYDLVGYSERMGNGANPGDVWTINPERNMGHAQKRRQPHRHHDLAGSSSRGSRGWTGPATSRQMRS